MKHVLASFKLLWLFVFLLGTYVSNGQTSDEGPQAVDVIFLKDGSKLQGHILEWDLDKGMSLKLLTGATVFLSKNDIEKVEQINTIVEFNRDRPWRLRGEYAFREKGWYQNSSGFLNFSSLSGVGLSHVMGYRYNRLLGVGLGIGIESNDLQRVRNIVPVFAEIRGFLLPKKISPYYALKVGYGIALRDELAGTFWARGGLHVSPEIGLRIGAGDVSFYTGLEYKLQNATFSSVDWWGGGSATEDISYRRVQLRTGLLF